MRTIKFRAWDNENSCYFEPTYEAYKGNVKDLNIGMGGGLFMRTLTSSTHCDSVFPDRFIIEQFTGLQDKNGRYIYEGDIIKTQILEKECIGIIQYADKWGCFYLGVKNQYGCGAALDSVHQWYYSEDEDSNECIAEVIGNIHENPKLLKL